MNQEYFTLGMSLTYLVLLNCYIIYKRKQCFTETNTAWDMKVLKRDFHKIFWFFVFIIL